MHRFDFKSNHIQLVETNATATAFGRVQTLAPPAHLFIFQGLEADASAGTLDIVALATLTAPGSSPAFFDTQVKPAGAARTR
jgi:hypothetical protein